MGVDTKQQTPVEIVGINVRYSQHSLELTDVVKSSLDLFTLLMDCIRVSQPLHYVPYKPASCWTMLQNFNERKMFPEVDLLS